MEGWGWGGAKGVMEVNGLAIVSSKLLLLPGDMEVRMPTAQGHQEDDMPSAKDSKCAWHTGMVAVILPFLLPLYPTCKHCVLTRANCVKE